jgi:hypothetical protein
LYVQAIGNALCPVSVAGQGNGTSLGCIALPAPLNVSFVDSTSNSVTFSWNAITGASGYRVEASIGSGPYTVVSANQAGTLITIPGLNSGDSVRIRVTTLGGLPCQNSITGTIGRAKSALDQIFIPNTFLPNSGVAANRTVGVYSNILRDGRFMIFNQWGQKVFEANTVDQMRRGWDGTFGGKSQPVGVYIYVGRFTLTNGSVIEKKGSINLVR